MATILALAAFGGNAPPTGVTTKEWTSTFDTNSTAGVVAYPTALSAAGHGILHVRGGTTGSEVSLGDSDIDALEDLVKYQSTAFGDPAGGRTVFAPAIRGCSSGVWPSGPASAGDDEFGGDDLHDLGLAWAAMDEIGLAAGTPAIHSGKKGAMAFSSGAMRLLKAIREGELLPKAVCLRAPLLNISYKGHVASDAVRGMIPGWTSPSGTKHEDLTSYERDQKFDRSPLRWLHRLPKGITWRVIEAENDTTIRHADTQAFVDGMIAEGHDIDLVTVPTAGHSFNTTELVFLANNHVRGFFNTALEA